ncbi:hypothetical protein B0H14DRAFT_2640593 [Mycena olivaceomarginata]|nr:hypothetical protein B0H14DRAFT_2640593 [Mycena olivaceomarginata]
MLVIEFPPGALILIPSTTLSHSNVPVQPGDTRVSFTQFTSGGLFRYVDNGCQTQGDLAEADPAEYPRLVQKKQSRWEMGLQMFSVIDELNYEGTGWLAPNASLSPPAQLCNLLPRNTFGVRDWTNTRSVVQQVIKWGLCAVVDVGIAASKMGREETGEEDFAATSAALEELKDIGIIERLAVKEGDEDNGFDGGGVYNVVGGQTGEKPGRNREGNLKAKMCCTGRVEERLWVFIPQSGSAIDGVQGTVGKSEELEDNQHNTHQKKSSVPIVALNKYLIGHRPAFEPAAKTGPVDALLWMNLTRARGSSGTPLNVGLDRSGSQKDAADGETENSPADLNEANESVAVDTVEMPAPLPAALHVESLLLEGEGQQSLAMTARPSVSKVYPNAANLKHALAECILTVVGPYPSHGSISGPTSYSMMVIRYYPHGDQISTFDNIFAEIDATARFHSKDSFQSSTPTINARRFITTIRYKIAASHYHIRGSITF